MAGADGDALQDGLLEVLAKSLKKGKAFEYPDLFAKPSFKVIDLVPWADHVEVVLKCSPSVKIAKMKLAQAFYTVDGRLDGKASLQPTGRLRSEWAHKCACNLSDMPSALRAAWRQQPKVSRCILHLVWHRICISEYI